MSQQSTVSSQNDIVSEIQLPDPIWDSAVSDTGIDSMEKDVKTKVYKSPTNRKFKSIWIAANELYTRMDSNRNRFPRLPKASSKTSILKKIGDLIFTERQLTDSVYSLPQEKIHFKLKCAYGLENETTGVTMNDIARAFGILCDPDFEIEKCTLLKMHGTNRAVVDDPSLNLANCCNRLMSVFHDENYIVSDPENWTDASEVEGFEELNPNDPIRIEMHTLRPSTFFKTGLIDPIKPVYREACRRWRSDTGGGAGQPENFIDWDPRNDYKFGDFTNGQSPALLTWIFMKDRSMNYVLETEADNLPMQFQIDDSIESNSATSSVGFGSASKKGRLNSFNNNIVSMITSTNDRLLEGIERLIPSNNISMESPARTVVTGNSSSSKKRDIDYYSQIANTAAECSKQLITLNSKLDKMDNEPDHSESMAVRKRKLNHKKSLKLAVRIQTEVLGGIEKELGLENNDSSDDDDNLNFDFNDDSE
jgi:hypothetical protein